MKISLYKVAQAAIKLFNKINNNFIQIKTQLQYQKEKNEFIIFHLTTKVREIHSSTYSSYTHTHTPIYIYIHIHIYTRIKRKNSRINSIPHIVGGDRVSWKIFQYLM